MGLGWTGAIDRGQLAAGSPDGRLLAVGIRTGSFSGTSWPAGSEPDTSTHASRASLRSGSVPTVATLHSYPPAAATRFAIFEPEPFGQSLRTWSGPTREHPNSRSRPTVAFSPGMSQDSAILNLQGSGSSTPARGCHLSWSAWWCRVAVHA